MLTRGQVDLVQRSHARLAPLAPQVAALFYDKLFERDPRAAALFRGDMAAQGERLMAMIAAVVARLDEPQALRVDLQALGARHAGYGIREAQYATVGGALLDTLALALGPEFTPVMRQAWAAFYGLCSRTMLQAAAPAPVPSTQAGEGDRRGFVERKVCSR